MELQLKYFFVMRRQVSESLTAEALRKELMHKTLNVRKLSGSVENKDDKKILHLEVPISCYPVSV